jgi:hypothetical protein
MRVHQTRSYGPNMNPHNSTIHTTTPDAGTDHGHSRHEHDHPTRWTNDSITVSVNGGATGWLALDWAAARASATHADLRIVHVISWPRWGLDRFGGLVLDWHDTNAPEHGTMILEDAARRALVVAPQTTITTRLEASSTVFRSRPCDALIGIGHGGTRRTRRSVERAVQRLAHGPVAIINAQAISASDGDS